MLAKAWDWAKSNGNHRVNPIHGDEEIYIVTSEEFKIESKDIEESEQQGSFAAQDCYVYSLHVGDHVVGVFFLQDDAGSLLDSDIPSINAPAESLLTGMNGTSATSGTQGSGGNLLGNTASVMSFKYLLRILSFMPYILEVYEVCAPKVKRLWGGTNFS